MEKYRTEKDLLGQKDIPANALYGIHTCRALENFPLCHRRINKALIQAYGEVKLACAQTNFELGYFSEKKYSAISLAGKEMADGQLDDHVLVDALQGGAGTSTNMNVNEVICNRALKSIGKNPGDYDIIHPIEDVNKHQSTNDTYPTALKVAAIRGLQQLEKELVNLLNVFQAKEKEFAHIVKIGRTQLQDAVLTTMGRTMSAYAEAIGRDRWRVFKCEERLRVVNLGGTAIGSGLSAPRKYIFKVVEVLKKITGLSLSRAENLVEATQNTDAFVEVHGILNACAANLIKIASDIRLMASGPSAGLSEIILPQLQAGSSLMPDKVNPVIPEALIQAGITVQANNVKISQASSMGNLELNAFMPLIADTLLESIQLLTNAVHILCRKCIEGITVNEEICRRYVQNSTAVLTALVDVIGYENAQNIARISRDSDKTIRELVTERSLITADQFDQIISAEAVIRLGKPDGETDT